MPVIGGPPGGPAYLPGTSISSGGVSPIMPIQSQAQQQKNNPPPQSKQTVPMLSPFSQASSIFANNSQASANIIQPAYNSNNIIQPAYNPNNIVQEAYNPGANIVQSGGTGVQQAVVPGYKYSVTTPSGAVVGTNINPSGATTNALGQNISNTPVGSGFVANASVPASYALPITNGTSISPANLQSSSTVPLDYASFGQNSTVTSSGGQYPTAVVTTNVNGNAFVVNTGVPYLPEAQYQDQAVQQAYGQYNQQINSLLQSSNAGREVSLNLNTGNANYNPGSILNGSTNAISASPAALTTPTVTNGQIVLPQNWSYDSATQNLYVNGNNPTAQQALQWASALVQWQKQQPIDTLSQSSQPAPENAPNWYSVLQNNPSYGPAIANLSVTLGITPRTFVQQQASYGGVSTQNAILQQLSQQIINPQKSMPNPSGSLINTAASSYLNALAALQNYYAQNINPPFEQLASSSNPIVKAAGIYEGDVANLPLNLASLPLYGYNLATNPGATITAGGYYIGQHPWQTLGNIAAGYEVLPLITEAGGSLAGRARSAIGLGTNPRASELTAPSATENYIGTIPAKDPTTGEITNLPYTILRSNTQAYQGLGAQEAQLGQVTQYPGALTTHFIEQSMSGTQPSEFYAQAQQAGGFYVDPGEATATSARSTGMYNAYPTIAYDENGNPYLLNQGYGSYIGLGNNEEPISGRVLENPYRFYGYTQKITPQSYIIPQDVAALSQQGLPSDYEQLGTATGSMVFPKENLAGVAETQIMNPPYQVQETVPGSEITLYLKSPNLGPFRSIPILRNVFPTYLKGTLQELSARPTALPSEMPSGLPAYSTEGATPISFSSEAYSPSPYSIGLPLSYVPTSLSPINESASPISSASVSPISRSISPSVSASPSVSPLVSVSPSVSPSVSLSPSVSVSPSTSPSTSPSMSPSTSPSLSLSPSVSPSVSLSPSPSPSPSLSSASSFSSSPSESPGVEIVPYPSYPLINPDERRFKRILYRGRVYYVPSQRVREYNPSLISLLFPSVNKVANVQDINSLNLGTGIRPLPQYLNARSQKILARRQVIA